MKKHVYLNFLIICCVVVLFSCSTPEDYFEYDLLPVKTSDNWGYIDKTGKTVIFPQYEEAYLFSDGLALVRKDKKYGYIDKEGKYIINPVYVSATPFKDGLALITTDNSYPTFINKKGEMQFIVNEADVCRLFSEDLAAFKTNNKWGFKDKTGKTIINPLYFSATDFKDGLVAVANEVNDKLVYGFINAKGDVKIQMIYEEAYSFENGLALVKLNGKYGFIDKEGKFTIEPKYDYAYSFADGLSRVKIGEKYGFIDKTGKFIVNPHYENVGNFSEGLAYVVNKDEKIGFINKEGVDKIMAQFEDARNFKNKLAAVKMNGKYGFIDTESKFVINCEYDSVYNADLYQQMVYSDFFNSKALSAFFTEKTDESSFRGITKGTNFGDISNTIHKSDKLLESSTTTLTVNLNKDIEDYAKIETVKYSFSDKIYTITDTYQFLHHWGNYKTGTRKDQNLNAKVKAIEVEMYLKGSASGKNDKMMKVIATALADKFKGKPTEITNGYIVETSHMKIEFVSESKALTGKILTKVSFK